MGLEGCDSIYDKKEEKETITAFYSDSMLERSLAIDLKTMSLRKEIFSTGENTYNVDILDKENTLDKVFVMTRGSDSVDVINTKTLENETTIDLQHYPRSSAYNSIAGLMLVSGKNKAMSSLIDVRTNEVVMVVGEGELPLAKELEAS